MDELVGQIQTKLPGKLLHHVMVDRVCIALYDVEGVSTFDRRRNVMAFDSNANMIWQIDPPAYIDDFINYYNGLAVEDGQVILTSIGAEKTLLAVNTETGRVSRADCRPVLIEDDRPENSALVDGPKMSKCITSKNTIQIAGLTTILPSKVKQHLEIDDVHLILCEPYGLSVFDQRRNVFAFERDGKLRWRIQPAYYSPEPNTYTELHLQGSLVKVGVFRADTTLLTINMADGSLTFPDGTPMSIDPDEPR